MASNNMPMSRKDITLAYMAFGGAPYYWTLLERDKSVEQNFDILFFSKNAPLAIEFKRLYRSVFESPEPYIAVVSTLGTRKAGLTREEIVHLTPNVNNDGTLTETQSWMQGPKTIEVHPDAPPPKARIKRKV